MEIIKQGNDLKKTAELSCFRTATNREIEIRKELKKAYAQFFA